MKRDMLDSNYDSKEFLDKVKSLYLLILERTPATAELNQHIEWMKKNEITIEELPNIFRNSDEYRVKNKIILDDQPKIITKKIFGHTLFLNGKDTPLVDSLSQSSYEKGTVDLLSKLIKKKMNVLNIGANIGYFTLLMAKLVGLSGKVYAFEPSSAFELLMKNVEFNGYKNTVIISKGVSNESGKKYLQIAPSSVHSYISSKDKGLEKVEIDVVSIDDFLKSKNIKIDFVMMDAEGSEKYILDGMEQTIKNNPNMEIITEYNPYTLELAGTNGEEFLGKIEELDFILNLISEDSGKIEPITKEKLLEEYQYPKYTNLYLAKKQL